MLPDLKANSLGIAVTQVVINSATISPTEWYINIHQAPGAEATLACGQVMPAM